MSNVTVGTSLTRIAEIDIQQAEVITVHLKNKGASALNTFKLKGRGANDLALGFVTIKESDFTVPGLHVIYASTEPGALASDAECILYLTPSYLQQVELWASVAVGSANVVIDVQRSGD